MANGELEFVEWLRRRSTLADLHPSVTLGVGDDMAILNLPSGEVLTSCDMLLDGVHFDTKRHDLALIGRKAIACSLSDCAAMAVCPAAVTVSVALPIECPAADAHRLYEGMLAIAAEFEVPIVGGDTTSWDRPLAIDVAITARPYEGIGPVRRSGAKPGDRLYVTGPLGGSLLGRHLTFTPRIQEARTLAQALGDRLHAMIDVSDGLSLDLWRVCEASAVGAVLDERELQMVVSEDAKQAAAADGRAPLDHALSDGEDFELLVVASGEIADPKVPLHPVGDVVEQGMALRRLDGRIERLEPKGYVH
jgi:thiamine-monophosphate kinase